MLPMKNFVIGMLQLAAACALVFALYVILRHGQREAEWPLVQGTIQGTRIVADHSSETKWGGQMTWKAEYRVTYSVAGREYTEWVDSGIRNRRQRWCRAGSAAITPFLSYSIQSDKARSVRCKFSMKNPSLIEKLGMGLKIWAVLGSFASLRMPPSLDDASLRL
jgi:hypothetical protein